MRLTKQMLLDGKSSRGGWSREQMRLLGVRWPLRKGWMDNVVYEDFPDETIRQFLELRDMHLTTQ